ncbi:MAG: hypothetical protein AAB873_01620 [Patescibacteria group bacterium]
MKEKKRSKENAKIKDVYSSTEMKHFLGSLAEAHIEELKGIKEGFLVMNIRFDRVEQKLDEHTKILDSHTKILDEHTRKLDSHSEMIGVLMEDTTVIRGDLKRKVDYDDFLSLLKRVQRIEAKI